jgi:hypothetical protein
MKTIVIFLLSMIFSVTVFGQIQEEKMKHVDVDEVQVVPPKFTEVKNAIQLMNDKKTKSIEHFLAKHIEYPEKDSKNFNQGTEVVQFTVLPTGELADFKIINGISPLINEEVVRVLKTTNGMWIPGYNNGDPVEMEKEISIVFKVTGSVFDKDFETLARKHFTKGSIALFTKENPKKSIKLFDKGIRLLPSDESLLFMRGMARYEVGDKDGAYQDWERINALGGNIDLNGYQAGVVELKGYAEANYVINK